MRTTRAHAIHSHADVDDPVITPPLRWLPGWRIG
jgi:hypothetical protein